MSSSTTFANGQRLGATPSQLAVAYSICRGITRSAAKNFYYAFVVLPRRKRDALCAVYAFMRQADDISDDPALPVEHKRARLDAWMDSLHRVVNGEPTDEPVLLALGDTQRRYKIPLELLDKLVAGTVMDVPASGEAIVYRTFADLYDYCYHVASVVGLVCIRVFGYRDPQAEKLAEELGVAFQLTNIIRDVKEDAALGRVYLPEEDLARFGLTPGDVAARNAEQVRPVLQELGRRARDFYASGDKLLEMIEEDSQPALWVLQSIYRRLLQKIADRNFDVFTQRVQLTTREKLAILAKGIVRRLT